MEAIKALIDSGVFSVIDLVLFGIIGILLHFVTTKQKANEYNINATIEGMQALLEEERIQTEKLSKVVFEVKKEIDKERDKNYQLREEILTLKAENKRLQGLVNDLERMVTILKEENAKLLKLMEREAS